MFIKNIYVQHFGILKDQLAEELSPQLNIFLGNNEAGKSTLLNFFRAMFFGFKRSNVFVIGANKNKGSSAGGSLELELANATAFKLNRHPVQGKKAGDGFSLLDSYGKEQDINFWYELLGGCTLELYDNVFSFALKELSSLESMNSPAVSSALHAAAFGTGAKSPHEILSFLNKRLISLLSGGSASEIKKLLVNLDSQSKALTEKGSDIELHATLINEQALLDSTLGEVKAKITKVKLRLERERSLKSSWDLWLKLCALQDYLTAFRVPEGMVSESALSRLESLQEQKTIQGANLELKQTKVENLEEALQSNLVNPVWLKSLTEAQELYREHTAIAKLEQDLPRLKERLKKIHTEQDEILTKHLDHTFDKASILEFSFSINDQEKVSKQEQELSKLTQERLFLKHSVQQSVIKFQQAVQNEKELRRAFAKEVDDSVYYLESALLNDSGESELSQRDALNKSKELFSGHIRQQLVNNFKSIVTEEASHTKLKDELGRVENSYKKQAIEAEELKQEQQELQKTYLEPSLLKELKAKVKNYEALSFAVKSQSTALQRVTEKLNNLFSVTFSIKKLVPALFFAALGFYVFMGIFSAGNFKLELLSKAENLQASFFALACFWLAGFIFNPKVASFGFYKKLAAQNLRQEQEDLQSALKNLAVEQADLESFLNSALKVKELNLESSTDSWEVALEEASIIALRLTELISKLEVLIGSKGLQEQAVQEQSVLKQNLEKTQELLNKLKAQQLNAVAVLSIKVLASAEEVLQIFDAHKQLLDYKEQLLNFEGQLEQAGLKEEQEKENWKALLQELGFTKHILPSILPKVIDYLEKFKTAEADQGEIGAELDLKSKEISSFKQSLINLTQNIIEYLKADEGTYSVEACNKLEVNLQAKNYVQLLADLYKYTNDAKDKHSAREKYESDLQDAIAELALLQKVSTANSSEINSILEKAQVITYLEYKENLAAHNKFTDLKNTQDKYLSELKTGVGLRAEQNELWNNFESVIESLKNTNLDALDSKVDELTEKLASLEQRNNLSYERLGEIGSELKKLNAGIGNASLRLEKALTEDKLRIATKEWASLRLAKVFIDKAKGDFEADRQDLVIQKASRYFAKMTDNAYTGIDFDLSVNFRPRAVHRLKGLALDAETVLSQGTKEQLYLALRLAYIAQHNQKHESLPAIMDDILVNFDPQRCCATAKIFTDFASTNQLLFFTCHPDTATLLQKLNPKANLYRIESGKIIKN